MIHPFIYLSSFLIILSCETHQSQYKGVVSKPNIIIILTDDHAYQAISAYGSKLMETPNIDRLANEGMLFNRGKVT